MRLKETQVIVLANQKGGCGKTTSSISIAAAFNKLGYSVCLIDTDSQCNATASFGIDAHDIYDSGEFTILDVFLKKKPHIDIAIPFSKERFPTIFSIVPSNPQVGEVGPHLEMEALMASRFSRSEISIDELKHEHRLRLKNSVESLKGLYDFVIIDTPPNLGFLMTSALVAANWFIIPVFPSKFDLAGLEELTRTISKVKELYNPKLKLAGVLLGMFDKNTKLHRQIYSNLGAKFTDSAMFKTTISKGVRMQELTFSNKTIFEFEASSQQAEQFMELVKEMLNRAGNATLRPLPDIERVIEHAEHSDIDLTKIPDEEDPPSLVESASEGDNTASAIDYLNSTGGVQNG